MADIINLNRVRKQRDKARKTATAAENRVTFGQRKADKEKTAAEADRAGRDLAGKKLEERED